MFFLTGKNIFFKKIKAIAKYELTEKIRIIPLSGKPYRQSIEKSPVEYLM